MTSNLAPRSRLAIGLALANSLAVLLSARPLTWDVARFLVLLLGGPLLPLVGLALRPNLPRMNVILTTEVVLTALWLVCSLWWMALGVSQLIGPTVLAAFAFVGLPAGVIVLLGLCVVRFVADKSAA